MKPERLFVGLVLVTLGGLLLLQNLGYINPFSLWAFLRQFWPLLLIGFGISLVMGRGSMGLGALLLVVIIVGGSIFSLVIGQWHYGFNGGPRHDVQGHWELAIPWDDQLEQLVVQVELAAGRLEVAGGTDMIAQGSLPFFSTPPQFRYNQNAGQGKLELERADLPTGQSTWHIQLTDRVPLDLKIDSGASSARLDLAQLQVDQVAIGMGASDLWLRLGEKRPHVQVEIEAGASRVTLVVPEGVETKIQVESPLSKVTLPNYRREGNTYYSSTYGTGGPLLEINVKAGASTLEVIEELAGDAAVEGVAI